MTTVMSLKLLIGDIGHTSLLGFISKTFYQSDTMNHICFYLMLWILLQVGLSRRITLKSFVTILSHFYDITKLITRKISFHELLSGNLYFISYYMSWTVLLILAQCDHTGSFLVRDSAVCLFLLSGQDQNQTETYPLTLNVKNLEAIFNTQCSPPSWI